MSKLRRMSALPPDQQARWNAPGPGPPGRSPRSRVVVALLWMVLLGGFAALVVVSPGSDVQKAESLGYSAFLSKVTANDVVSVSINQGSGVIDGNLKSGKTFTAQGPTGGLPDTDLQLLAEHRVARDYAAPTSSILPTLLTWSFRWA